MRNITFGNAELDRVKSDLNEHQKFILYHALVQRHFGYCSVVWSMMVSESLAIAQRKAPRALTNYHEHVTLELLARLNICYIYEGWKRDEAVWLYKIISPGKTIPEYMM